MGRPEASVETHLVRRCQEQGWLCLKFTSPGTSGVPDRVVISPGSTFFVEVKRPGGSLRPLQRLRTERMRAAGATMLTVSTRSEVDELVSRVVTHSKKRESDNDFS